MHVLRENSIYPHVQPTPSENGIIKMYTGPRAETIPISHACQKSKLIQEFTLN